MPSTCCKSNQSASPISSLSCEASEICGKKDIFSSRPPVNSRSSPGLTQRPVIKEEPGEAQQARMQPTHKAPVVSAQPFVPKWLQKSGGGQGSIPGVGGQTH
ncbi:uncharacterized protein N7511_008512 [Penicillium nucicola]|uniref:uncharacterized protein n=1 Tax=Penicillium nucicola TaxID=1850975 RepID=UPI002544FB64|nr:uncharacterized protein N7511_008512 [Penicillium nucicola]KAJ5751547.1 hypothetical protein N7511_008512 [Penicillium nucicola]